MPVSKHATVMSVLKAIINGAEDAVTAVKASEPELHLGIRPAS